jgi:prophage regulatory protein
MDQETKAKQIERLPATIARTGLSRSSIYSLISKKAFVRPVKLSARAIGFLSDEVDDWIAARAAARN